MREAKAVATTLCIGVAGGTGSGKTAVIRRIGHLATVDGRPGGR
jgi:uridine kinase